MGGAPYQRKVQQDLGVPYRQDLDLPTAATVAPVAAGVQALGAGAADIVKAKAEHDAREQKKLDQAVMLDAWSKMTAAKLQAETAMRSLRGRDALAASVDAVKAFDKQLDTLGKGLGNEHQRATWAEWRSRASADFRQMVAGHAEQQANVYAQQALESAADTADQLGASAAAAGGDRADEAISEARAAKLEAFQTWANNQGWDEKILGQKRRELMTSFHAGVIEAMIVRNETTRARDYLGEARRHGELDAGVATKLEARLRKKDDKTRAMHIADGIVTAVNLDAGPWEFNLAGMLEAARNNETLRGDAEMMDLVVADIRDRNAANEASKDANDGEKLARLRQGLHDPRNPNRLTIPWASDDFQGMTGDGRARYLAEVEAERDQATAKGRERAERNWWDFMSRPLEDRLGVDVDKAYPNSPKAERDKMRAYQVNTGKPGVGVREFDAAVARKIVEHQISTKKPPGGKDLSDAEKYSRFLANKYYEWKRRAKNEKDEPTEEDIAKMFAEALEERKERSGWWIFSRETRTPAYKAPMEAPPAATEPPAEKTKRITRTDPTTGEVRYWNGTAWVRE